MGLFGRKSLASRVKTMANLVISRISILKNQHHVRCSYARSDIVQLLHLGHRDRALLRQPEEQTKDTTNQGLKLWLEVSWFTFSGPKPTNLLSYIALNLDWSFVRRAAVESQTHSKQVSTFGQEFTLQCVELRKSCGVHPKMIEKLSTHLHEAAGIEKRQKVVNQIAIDSGIGLRPDENQDKQRSKSTQEE